jgi:hypothetical protein
MLDNSLTGPISFSDGIETSNFLATWIIFDESNITRDINLGLLFGDLYFLLSNSLGAEATAITNDMLCLAEECWMTMKINSTIFGLIPLGVQQQILGVK